MLTKYKYTIFFLFSLILICKIPINEISDIFFIIISIIIFISSDYKKSINYNKFLIFISLIIFVSLFNENKLIIEKNGIFLPNNKNITKYNNYNKNLFSILKDNFFFEYKDKNINCENNNNCWENTELVEIFSKNYYNIFNNNNVHEKKISSINHNNISNAKIGMINRNEFQWSDWLNKIDISRQNAPYFILYDFENYYFKNSKLCWSGNAILINQNYKNVNNIKKNCLLINNETKILFYNFDQSLNVKLEKDIYHNFFDFVFLFLKILSLFFLFNIITNKFYFKLFLKNSFIILLTSISILYVYYNREIFNFGYNPLRAGMDGLVHEGKSRIMADYLYNFNLNLFLKGTEEVYYFMPGLRYILAIKKFIFGNNFYGTIIILIFLPITLYYLLVKLNLNKKFCFLFIIFFILIKVPYIGYSFNHLIRGGLTHFPEMFSFYFFILFLLTYLNKHYLISSIFCFLMIFLRPNYLPIFFIFSIYIFFQFLTIRDLKKFILSSLGLVLILLIPLHNLYYGNGEFSLITSSSSLPNSLKITIHDYLSIFTDQNTKLKIFDHWLNWITTGERENIFPYIINSLLIINLLFFSIYYKNKHENILTLMILFAISQQLMLLFYNNTGRFAYFPWFLVLLTNILIIDRYFNFNILKKKLKNFTKYKF